ncbi:hypothetical protein F2P81_022448 [Xyrichtys novacula]|uniref:VOC domain-containing protein n=1 Tax=Xyrichtys novacula TaxID=13765 RepID=A0AAV1H4C3_XYRNO|nr:hypothetical protein F2P81_022448 [Xyrichtys novacula]
MAAYLSRLHHISLHVSNVEKIANDLVSKFKFNLFATRLTDSSRQLAFRKGAAVFVVNERPNHGDGRVKMSPGPHLVNTEKYNQDNLAKYLYDVNPHYSVDTVSNVCFEVEDVERSFKTLRHMGCSFVVPPTTVQDECGAVTYSVVKSIVGNVCHTLLDRTKYEGSFLPGFDVIEKDCSSDEEDASCPITHFDHITYACPRKTSHQVMRWYEKLFGFQRFFIVRNEDVDEGFVVNQDGIGLRLTAMEYWKCSELGISLPFVDKKEPDCKFVIAESLPEQGRNQVDTFLEKHRAPGIQHIGLYTKNIVSTAHVMAEAGVQFFSPPLTYYTEVGKQQEIEEAGHDPQMLAQHGILLDTDLHEDSSPQTTSSENRRYLLQVFTKPIFEEDTFFLELIERRGATGFGEGNIRALWSCPVIQTDRPPLTSQASLHCVVFPVLCFDFLPRLRSGRRVKHIPAGVEACCLKLDQNPGPFAPSPRQDGHQLFLPSLEPLGTRMCVAMVIIFKKTLEKKGADDVTSKSTDLGQFQAQTMTQGTALFSCGLMETSRWHEVGHSCSVPQRPVGTSLESLWDVLPEVHKTSAHWDWDVGSTSSTITSLLQDLNLTEAASSHSTAPPSKRQCRSLSCSDELGGCRSAWRPQSSRVWTTVEKRRCHSGGSVQRGGVTNSALGFPAMQRSSSFSLPTRSNTLELPCFTQPTSHCPSAFSSLTPSSEPPAQPLYLSEEQICEPRGPSPPSSPDSTPELERRGGQGGLARSRSQPCVLNDKKIGVKRRRPADSQKQRPSLDLAKMTQKLRNFHSLSCPGITGEDVCESNQTLFTLRSPSQCDTDDSNTQPRTKEGQTTRNTLSDRTIEEADWTSTDYGDLTPGTTNGKDSEPLWAGLCSLRKDVYQLGGELDIEQIERN